MNSIEYKIREPRLQTQAGFSLLEVLVALVIFAVGMLGLLATSNSVMDHQRRNKNKTLAVMHTTDKLEEIKRLGTNEPTGGAFGFEYLVSTYPTTESMTAVDDYTYTKSETFDNFQRTWSLQVYPSGGSEDFTDPTDIHMVQATVKVEWTRDKTWGAGSAADGDIEFATVLQRRQFIE